MKMVLPADTFSVVNKTTLSGNDHKYLIMLYQPIIGVNAVCLYLNLESYLDKSEIMSAEITHHQLMTNMGMKLDDIIEARIKLEGIGLLKTYFKEGNINNYVYELYSPLNANEFINNPILSICLYNNVGKTEFQKKLDFFKLPKINLDEYNDISSSFNNVFEMISLPNFNYIEDIRGISKNNIDLVSNIDIDSVISNIPESMLNYKSVTKEIRDLIYKLSFIYSFKEDDVLDIIKNSINENRNLSKDLLRKNSKNYYNFEHNGTSPKLLYKNQPEYLRNKNNELSKRAKIIHQFETISPYEFLLSKNNGVRPTKSEVEILDYLLLDLNMMPGVVNVLIDYVLRINDNKLVKNFIITIASQWIKSDIKTVNEAMMIAEKEYKKTKSKKEKNTKLPKWFNEEIEEAYDDSKAKQMEDMLKNFK